MSKYKTNRNLWIDRWFSSSQNNGVDSLLCGAFSDFGFAPDANFAQTIHHRLFETVNAQGETRRNDLIAINICRGREHGLQGYNAYRQFCGLKRANQFQDFADTMSFESAQKLQMIYKYYTDWRIVGWRIVLYL